MNMSFKFRLLIATLLIIFISLGVFSNVMQQNAVDKTKLPEKVELSKGFQRWITNIKNKGIPMEADSFRLKEDNQVYNSKWTTISSLDTPGVLDSLSQTLADHQNIKKVVFSPSKKELIDYRNIDRDGYRNNEVRFYGQKEEKVIDTKILDCSVLANCYFDRAFFLDNDVFVVSEISRNIDKKDTSSPVCSMDQTCTYTVKMHVIDLINNSRLVYESPTFDTVLKTLIPAL
jgi:hypothetical protein